jgi:MinD-like ATPase involved in chromosome partitioning or flagellar assembly
VLLAEMERVGIAADSVRLVLNHRVRFDTQFPAAEVEETLGHPIEITLRPAPELMMAAARRKMPGVLAMPEDPVAQQILNLADSILAAAESAPN